MSGYLACLDVQKMRMRPPSIIAQKSLVSPRKVVGLVVDMLACRMWVATGRRMHQIKRRLKLG